MRCPEIARLLLLVCLVIPALPAVSSAATITLQTSDGARLEADWVAPTGAKRGVLVVLHEYRRDRTVWAPLAAAALKEGLGILAVDLRGHGASSKQGKEDWSKRAASKDTKLFHSMIHDVEAALAFLTKAGWPAEKVVLVGASVGCSVALHYGHAHPKSKLAGAVLLTPGQKYLGLPSTQHVAAWSGRPLLMVVGADESKAAQALYKLIPDRKRAAVLQVKQKKVHGTRMFGKVPRIEGRLAEWAAHRLGKKAAN
ncbi:MAG: pimeloyl-ACP methyl ester carboxylesterase [Myxococcota bacterium]|jgi:pimeloyl-ACP methyl ester carboxylesterase